MIAAVVRREPDQRRVPERMRPLLEACLEKDSRNRLRDIGIGARLVGEGTPALAAEARARHAWPLRIVAGVALLGLGALGLVHFRETPPEQLMTRGLRRHDSTMRLLTLARSGLHVIRGRPPTPRSGTRFRYTLKDP